MKWIKIPTKRFATKEGEWIAQGTVYVRSGYITAVESIDDDPTYCVVYGVGFESGFVIGNVFL